MNLLSPLSVQGHHVELARSDPRHLAGSAALAAPALKAGPSATAAPPTTESEFGKMFFSALNQVNDLQNRSMVMSEAMITDPESVDIHDITVALAEANLSLSMTKAIVDRAIRAYREILSVH
jgi:flagellar hook-basal body complex protein FliE